MGIEHEALGTEWKDFQQILCYSCDPQVLSTHYPDTIRGDYPLVKIAHSSQLSSLRLSTPVNSKCVRESSQTAKDTG